jgi:hypothetical protein
MPNEDPLAKMDREWLEARRARQFRPRLIALVCVFVVCALIVLVLA